PDELKGQVPRAFVVLKAGAVADPAELQAELAGAVGDRIGPIAALRRVDVVRALPKTRSGKILRKTMRGIADGLAEPVPSTIEDVSVLDDLRPVLGGASTAEPPAAEPPAAQPSATEPSATEPSATEPSATE